MARSAFVTRLTGLYSGPYSGLTRTSFVMQPCKNPQGRASLKESDAEPAVRVHDATGETDTSSAATREGHAIEKSSPSRVRFGL